MSLFLPVFITRSAAWGMADSAIAIPAISPEHVLPVMGSQFPESALTALADLVAAAPVVNGLRGSNRRSATPCTALIAELIQKSEVMRGELGRHSQSAQPDASGRQLEAHELPSAGYDTDTAGHGGEALASMRAPLPDILLLDLQMPGADGLQFRAQQLSDTASTASFAAASAPYFVL